jgi:hypothetical protein
VGQIQKTRPASPIELGLFDVSCLIKVERRKGAFGCAYYGR